ncbi:MAG: hypothetical protein QXT79_08790, partial [Thermofilaceae archaeon]
FKLFTLKMSDVAEVLKRHGINSVDEYYSLVGVLPPYSCVTAPPPEDLVVATFIIDLITPPWDALRYAILLDLLQLTEKRTEKFENNRDRGYLRVLDGGWEQRGGSCSRRGTRGRNHTRKKDVRIKGKRKRREHRKA